MSVRRQPHSRQQNPPAWPAAHGDGRRSRAAWASVQVHLRRAALISSTDKLPTSPSCGQVPVGTSGPDAMMADRCPRYTAACARHRGGHEPVQPARVEPVQPSGEPCSEREQPTSAATAGTVPGRQLSATIRGPLDQSRRSIPAPRQPADLPALAVRSSGGQRPHDFCTELASAVLAALPAPRLTTLKRNLATRDAAGRYGALGPGHLSLVKERNTRATGPAQLHAQEHGRTFAAATQASHHEPGGLDPAIHVPTR